VSDTFRGFDAQPTLRGELLELRPLRLDDYDEQRGEVEIGWTFLARSHWGGTYNRELKDLMLAHAFRFVRNVVFLIGPDNLRSQRAVEKIGATRSGSRPDAYGRESFVYRISARS
jgi:N-acetyltransferase